MASVDDTFDLDQDDRAMLAEEIKKIGCESDSDNQVFAAWIEKHKKLMKEKTHSYKKDQKEKAEASKKELTDKLAKAGVKATFDEKTLNLKEVIASVREDKDQTHIPNTPSDSNGETLKERYKKAFGGGLTIGGKTIGEITKE